MINDIMTFIIYKLIILLKVGPSVIIVGYPNGKAFRPEVYITIGRKKNVIGIGKWSGEKNKDDDDNIKGWKSLTNIWLTKNYL